MHIFYASHMVTFNDYGHIDYRCELPSTKSYKSNRLHVSFLCSSYGIYYILAISRTANRNEYIS